MVDSKKPKAYIVAASMGYGHERAAIALREFAYGNIIHADDYANIPKNDRIIWHDQRHWYETISRMKNIPLVGEALFDLMDKFQTIKEFYPRRDLKKPTLQLHTLLRIMRKKQWGKHLIDTLNKKPLPLVATFFTVAHMADYFGYRGSIYCTVTDTDCSRAWVALNPAKSRIQYFAPTYRVAERLMQYGVPKEHVHLTGFPLPRELFGDHRGRVLSNDIANRIINLDPEKHYCSIHGKHILERLHLNNLPKTSNHALTLTFAVGGAGAQQDIGASLIKSLAEYIRESHIRVILVAGTNPTVRDFFKRAVIQAKLNKSLGKNLFILWEKEKQGYFNSFNKLLHTTDILWTKPSELSFYTALGIPLIIAPPIGSQEKFNKEWLMTLDAGIPQQDPSLAHEWLFDCLQSGFLAKAAMAGYREAPRWGTWNIGCVLRGRQEEMKPITTVAFL